MTNGNPLEFRATPFHFSNEHLAAACCVVMLVVVIVLTILTRNFEGVGANNIERDRQRLAWCQGRCTADYPYDRTCTLSSFKAIRYPRDKDKHCKNKRWKTPPVDTNGVQRDINAWR